MLPRGATPVDFAFAVHTDVGHLRGAPRQRQDGAAPHSAPERRHRRDHHQAGHKPSRDWLTFVETSRARSKIRHLLQLVESTIGSSRSEVVREGSQALRRQPEEHPGPTPGSGSRAESGMQKVDDLLAAVGSGERVSTARLLLGKARAAAGPAERKPPEAGLFFATVKKVLRSARRRRTRFGSAAPTICWSSAPSAAIRSRRGREDRRLHHARQGRVGALLLVPERHQPDVRPPIAGSTSSGTPGDDPSAPYTVRLSIQVEDRKGMLAAISSQVSAINTNIRTMEATTDQEGRASIEMTVEIQDVKHLDKVIKSIKGVEGVLGVERLQRARARWRGRRAPGPQTRMATSCSRYSSTLHLTEQEDVMATTHNRITQTTTGAFGIVLLSPAWPGLGERGQRARATGAAGNRGPAGRPRCARRSDAFQRMTRIGRVEPLGDHSFLLVDGSGQRQQIPYRQVVRSQRPSKTTVVLAAAGATAVVMMICAHAPKTLHTERRIAARSLEPGACSPYGMTAIASISIRTSRGRRATCTVALAGGGSTT